MITDIIFDFFGTIANIVPANENRAFTISFSFLLENGFTISYDSFRAIFKDEFNCLDLKCSKSLSEFNMNEVGRRFFAKAFGVNVPKEMIEDFISIYNSEFFALITPVPHISELFLDLSGRYRLSIISNTHSPQMIPFCLRRFGLESFITRIVTSVECGVRKPHPKIFKTCLSDLQCEPCNAVYIGDNYTSDYLGACRAGIKGILVDPDYAYASIVASRVDSTLDVSKIIKTWDHRS